MLTKETLNKILNNNYSKVEFLEDDSIVKLTYGAKLIGKPKILQTLQYFELKTICLDYAVKNKFSSKLDNKLVDFTQWFFDFELNLNKES